jgi:hypothetical protein
MIQTSTPVDKPVGGQEPTNAIHLGVIEGLILGVDLAPDQRQ